MDSLVEPVSTVNSHYRDKTVFLGWSCPGEESKEESDFVWRQEAFDVRWRAGVRLPLSRPDQLLKAPAEEHVCTFF